MGQINTPDEQSRERDQASLSRDRESNARYQEWLKTQSPDAPASADQRQPTAQQANVQNEQANDEEDKEAPDSAFSHYLTLANGKTVRYDVGNDPYAPFPASWNGVPVVQARGSA